LEEAASSHIASGSGIVALKIVRYDEPQNPRPTGGFYLIAMDSAGNDLSDTWHEDVEDALAQAEHGFGIDPHRWQSATGETDCGV
jgi:hypothetical protein